MLAPMYSLSGDRLDTSLSSDHVPRVPPHLTDCKHVDLSDWECMTMVCLIAKNATFKGWHSDTLLTIHARVSFGPEACKLLPQAFSEAHPERKLIKKWVADKVKEVAERGIMGWQIKSSMPEGDRAQDGEDADVQAKPGEGGAQQKLDQADPSQHTLLSILRKASRTWHNMT